VDLWAGSQGMGQRDNAWTAGLVTTAGGGRGMGGIDAFHLSRVVWLPPPWTLQDLDQWDQLYPSRTRMWQSGIYDGTISAPVASSLQSDHCDERN